MGRSNDRDGAAGTPEDDGAPAVDRKRAADPRVIAGFAAGVGAVFVATLGVFWNYWSPETSAWLWASGSFLIGAALGAGWAVWRRIRV